MKKILILLILIFCITGCSWSKEKIKTPAQDGVVIHYLQEEGTYEGEFKEGYTIDLYSNKLIVVSFLKYDALYEKTLTNEEYQKIIDFAFSNKILNLDEIDINIEPQKKSILCLYFNDNTDFITDGKSSTDKNYLELANLLYELSN